MLTTHYIEEAERLCDEVAILDSGSVVAVATPAELKGRGADRIIVELRSPPATTPDVLADDERVESVTLDGHQLVVTARKGGLVAPDLVRALDRAGLEIVDLEISRTSLEEVFVEMTHAGHNADSDESVDSEVDRDGNRTDRGGKKNDRNDDSQNNDGDRAFADGDHDPQRVAPDGGSQ